MCEHPQAAQNSCAIKEHRKGVKSKMDTLSLILIVIGALNWGLVGIFQFDLVAAIFGGMSGVVSRIIYTLVGLAGNLGHNHVVPQAQPSRIHAG